MHYILLLISAFAHSSIPTLKARKVVLPNGNFKIESPTATFRGQEMPVGFRDSFHGVCRSMGGRYGLTVEQQRVTRSPMVNVDDNGKVVGVSDRNYVTKSITCQI